MLTHERQNTDETEKEIGERVEGRGKRGEERKSGRVEERKSGRAGITGIIHLYKSKTSLN